MIWTGRRSIAPCAVCQRTPTGDTRVGGVLVPVAWRWCYVDGTLEVRCPEHEDGTTQRQMHAWLVGDRVTPMPGWRDRDEVAALRLAEQHAHDACRCGETRGLHREIDSAGHVVRVCCDACRDAERACVECGITSATMVRLVARTPLARWAEDRRVSSGAVEHRHVCIPCLQARSETRRRVSDALGRGVSSDMLAEACNASEDVVESVLRDQKSGPTQTTGGSVPPLDLSRAPAAASMLLQWRGQAVRSPRRQ